MYRKSIKQVNLYVCMKKVATVTLSIEETVSLGQGERGPDRDSYFPKVNLYIPWIKRENGHGILLAISTKPLNVKDLLKHMIKINA